MSFQKARQQTNQFFQSDKSDYLANQLLSVRMGFLRKVYGLVTSQIVFTFLFIEALFHSPEGIRSFVEQSYLMYILAAIGCVVGSLAVYFKRHSHPQNLLWLTFFTVCESYTFASYALRGNREIFELAFFFTSFVFLALTLYTFQSKREFTMIPGIMLSLSGVSLSLVISLFLFPRNVDTTIRLLLAIGIFSASLSFVYHTKSILRTSKIDDAFPAAVTLYTDFIRLLWKIYRLISSLQKENNKDKKKKKKGTRIR
ncbi:hypothetical protein M0813_16524 [Anaeramoeba flamelloides]|uniref:Uncharacterized protein n=1 Tax=Anaeramoeba flamelloides TaxID=1746091 RepID=A0ABQ8YYV7_9EUKA|nr:hypothetical protein M0813_16524 [Anaeramoeba flamelloides]